MKTSNDTDTQPMLFPDMEACTDTKRNYQIKRTDDVLFGLRITVTGEEDPEILALEQLGYFVVPEAPSDI